MANRSFPATLCWRFILAGGLVAGVAGFQLFRDVSKEAWGLFLGLAILGVAAVGMGCALLALARQKPKHVRLGSILRWRYRLDEQALTDIAAQAQSNGKRLGEMAVELGYLTEGELALALREQEALNTNRQ